MRRFPSISMCLPPSPCPSCCRHVCFLMPTGLSLMRALSPVMPSVSFLMLICPFLILSPSFSFAPWRRTGGEGHGAHRTRPDLFWCYPLCGTDFCLCCVCPFLMFHEALSIHLHVSPSISMSPSCCRHVCFLMPTGLSLMRAVSPVMPSVSFLMLICPSLIPSPSFSYAPWRRWDGGEGHGANRTRPDLFWCYPLCGTDFCLCCVCPFLMLHEALSIHLHVSPSISMSILLSTCLFSYAHGSFSYACVVSCYAIGVFFDANLSFSYTVPLFFFCSMAQDGGGGARGPSYKTRPFLVLSFMRN